MTPLEKAALDALKAWNPRFPVHYTLDDERALVLVRKALIDDETKPYYTRSRHPRESAIKGILTRYAAAFGLWIAMCILILIFSRR
jgi:hypothetical protein